FFQAEDGIRDRNVTGVQTCALPILMTKLSSSLSTRRFRIGYNELLSFVIITNKRKVIMNMKNPKDSQTNKRKVIMNMKNPKDSQIGRASCRERVESEEAVGRRKRQK